MVHPWCRQVVVIPCVSSAVVKSSKIRRRITTFWMWTSTRPLFSNRRHRKELQDQVILVDADEKMKWFCALTRLRAVQSRSSTPLPAHVSSQFKNKFYVWQGGPQFAGTVLSAKAVKYDCFFLIFTMRSRWTQGLFCKAR